MINKLKELEQISKELEGNFALRNNWKHAVMSYADDFLQNVNNINAFNNVIVNNVTKLFSLFIF